MFGFLSNDPLVSSLRSFGYNVVRLPRTDIQPLQVLTKKNDEFQRLGEVSSVFKSRGNVAIPRIHENIAAANISGQKSGNLSLGLGLSILGGIISAFSGSPFVPDAKYQRAKSISFQYEEVLEDNIEIAELDQFLTDADINPFSTYVTDLLQSDQVYLTTSTLKSRKFTIYPKASKGVDLAIQIPQIQGIVGSNIKVSGQSQDSSAITFEGNVFLVFGFQAVQLYYDSGHYTRQEPVKVGTVMRGSAKTRGAKLLSQKPFIDLGK